MTNGFFVLVCEREAEWSIMWISEVVTDKCFLTVTENEGNVLRKTQEWPLIDRGMGRIFFGGVFRASESEADNNLFLQFKEFRTRLENLSECIYYLINETSCCAHCSLHKKGNTIKQSAEQSNPNCTYQFLCDFYYFHFIY